MSEQDYNNKSSNKKHLRKQIEAQKRAKKDKNDEENIEEDVKDDDDENSQDNNEKNDKKDEDDEDEDDEDEDDEDDKKLNNKNVKESSKLNISNESSSVFGNTSSVFGNTSSNSVFGNTNSNSLFGNTNLNSPFSSVETVQDNFGFTNNTTEFDQELENEIHIYKLLNRKKTNHYNTVIKGLKYLGEKRMKELLGMMKKKFGIGGHIGMMEDIDEKEEVIFLQGNYATKAIDFLIKELKRAECYFILHD